MSRFRIRTPDRRSPGARALALAAMLLVAALMPCAARAQLLGRSSHATAPPPADDGLGPRELYLKADSLTDDRDRHTVIATGHVEARMQGRTLRADRLAYDTVTGAAHAVGHAVIVNADGTSEYGQDILLDDQFRAAVAYGFAAHEQANTTIAAGAAIRRNETIDQLNNAVYTPCDLCAADGAAKAPTWNITASRIIQDRARHVIYYRNAVVRVKGVPIFYSPVFWHPDPTAPRRSGFLTPRIEISSRRGFSIEQPYLVTLGPSTDLIVSPQINTRVNPLLNLEYTERFYSGLIDLRAGYTYSEEFDNHTFFNKDSSRSYILGQGLFNIDPYWRWGFGAERVTDPTLFARYGVHDVYTDRGPYPTDTDRLVSQLFTQRQDDDTFVSIAAVSFESLRAYGRYPADDPTRPNEVIGENNKAFPIVAPLIEAKYDPTEPLLGGQLDVRANIVDLIHEQGVINVNDPSSLTIAGPQQNSPQGFTTASYLSSLEALPIAKQTGLSSAQQLTALTYGDVRRASLDAQWRRTFTLDDGIRISPFAVVRGDLFSVSDSTLYRFSGGAYTAQAGQDTITRGLPTIGADVSWPFIRMFGTTSLTLEPLAQVLIAPVLHRNPNIPDEDSVSFEYDDTNLFSVDRFAGYDLLESGQRLNLGARATVDWGDSRNASFIFGRTYRAQPDYAFTSASGLQGTSSDYVTDLSVTPIAGVSFFTRARLASDTLTVRQQDTGLSLALGTRVNLGIRYNYNQEGLQLSPEVTSVVNGQTIITGDNPVVQHTRDASIAGSVFLTRHWGVSANVSRDFSDQVHYPVEQIGLVYLDECIRVDVLYTHDEIYTGVIGSTNSISFRLTLATLGGSGSPTAPRAGSR